MWLPFGYKDVKEQKRIWHVMRNTQSCRIEGGTVRGVLSLR